MATGEAWIFDNWRSHHVENGATTDHVHLVADTSGTADFWQFALGAPPPRAQWRVMAPNPVASARLLTECDQRSAIMPAAEVELLVEDLRAELTAEVEIPEAQARAARFSMLLQRFVQDWRQLCALHGVHGQALPAFQRLVGQAY